MMKISLVLHNIRSTYNVGAILRTAEGLGVKEVIYSGYTPRYDDPALLPHLREKLNRQIAKAALDAEKIVPQVRLSNETELAKWLEAARNQQKLIIGLENNLAEEELPRRWILGQPRGNAPTVSGNDAGSDRRNMRDTAKLGGDATGGTAGLDEDIVLILGEEVSGIPAEIRKLVDYFLEIPMQGQKESFNVSVATGIALWGLQNCY